MPSRNRLLVTSALGAAATANALRPVARTGPLSAPAFAFGLPTSELPIQAAIAQALTAAVSRRHRDRHDWRNRLALALTAASCAGLVWMEREGLRSGQVLEQALVDELGQDYRRRITEGFTPEPDVALTQRRILLPDFTTRRRYRAERDLSYGEFGTRNLLDVWRRADLPNDAPRSRAVPDSRRRVGHGKQEGPSGAAHGPPGRAGLGVRGPELPPEPAIHLA